VAGSAGPFGVDSFFGVIWHNGTPVILDFLPGFGNTFLSSINSSGYAVGDSAAEGEFTAFGAGGRAIIASPVPEPGTLLLCGMAVLFTGAWRRRRVSATP
jgi:hypothetical protein